MRNCLRCNYKKGYKQVNNGGCTVGVPSPSEMVNCNIGVVVTIVGCAAGKYNSDPNTDTCTDCAAGRYGKVAGLIGATCSGPCPAGTYGTTGGLTSAACSAKCPAGTYGSATGLTTAACTGLCTAGYACAAGSTTATAAICAAGKYSLAGAGACTNCPAGLFGDTDGLTTDSCTGLCTAGLCAFVNNEVYTRMHTLQQLPHAAT
jgi:hypothetical protein